MEIKITISSHSELSNKIIKYEKNFYNIKIKKQEGLLMAKLTGEQKRIIDEVISKYNKEAEIITGEYQKIKNDVEFSYFESDEEYEEKLDEALFNYKEKIRGNIWGIVSDILHIFGIEMYIKGYNIHNNLDIYTIESLANDFKLEITCDDADSNKIIEYKVMQQIEIIR